MQHLAKLRGSLRGMEEVASQRAVSQALRFLPRSTAAARTSPIPKSRLSGDKGTPLPLSATL